MGGPRDTGIIVLFINKEELIVEAGRRDRLKSIGIADNIT
jgi:hypothetical protein